MKSIVRGRSLVVLGLGVLMALAGLAAACGGGGGDESNGGSSVMGEHMQTAMDHMGQMIAAAEGGDLDAAKTHLEAADPALHEVIDDLKGSDAALATDLEEAVEYAEADIESGEEAEHIVEIGDEIVALLGRAE